MADEPTGSEVMPRRETGVRTVALGPFRTYASAERAAEAQATAHGLSGYRVFQKIVVKSGGLVVSAKGEPRRDVIERLRAAGIKDFLQMNVPPYDGRVALGYYLSDVGVERRVRHLQRVGVNSEVVARETETTEYWVELKTPGDFDTATLNLPGKELQLVDGHGGR